MKKWIELLIFPLIGFGIGFFAGERIGEKIERKNSKDCCDVCKNIDLASEPEPEKRPDEQIVRDEGYISEDEETEATEEYFARFEHPEEDGDSPEEKPEELKETVDPNRFIEIIDVDAWEAEETFSKIELFYYEDDEVVCDEDDHRLEDYEELIGPEALSTFGENLLNPSDCVYIRNTWTECVYQVTRIHNAYGRVVLGLEDEYPI